MAARERVLLLVGTKKGAFLLMSDPQRTSWDISGPHLKGNEIFHVARDPRESKIYAALNNPIWARKSPRHQTSAQPGATRNRNPASPASRESQMGRSRSGRPWSACGTSGPAGPASPASSTPRPSPHP